MVEQAAARAILTGKVAIVTGAASGIGAATVRAFIAEGAKVVCVDRDKVGLGELTAELGDAASAVAADITDDDTPARVVDHTLTTFGQIDVVVNSAGVLETQPVEEVTREIYDRVMGINVRGPFFLTQQTIRHLKAGASLIFLASGNSVIASPNGAVYATSKGAIVSMVKGFAADLSGRGIRTNVISPGPIVTPLLATALAAEGVKESLEGGVPAGRLGTPEEIAAVAVFLASDSSSYMYGSNLAVDGGTTSVWSPSAPGNETAGE